MDWSRKEVKTVGNEMLHTNYWKTVFVSALLMVLSIATMFTAMSDFVKDVPEAIKDIQQNFEQMDTEVNLQVAAVIITLGFGLLLLSTVFKIVFDIFIKNPVEIGAKLFMRKNLQEEHKGMIADITYVFDHNYITNVKNMFVVTLIQGLWTCLLVIPGIVKYYEYKMVPYILSEEENLSPKEVMVKSRNIMKGQKWKAFLLDLSFVPWHILGGLSLGILELFYVNPYIDLTEAVLYEKLKQIYLMQQGETNHPENEE